MKQTQIQLIPINEIHILNPRVRSQIIAEEIRRNIRNLGLKRPITVTVREKPQNSKKYDLVCGQGRLEAFIEAGESEIPAVVFEAGKDKAHVMSLVENIARRQNNSLELLQSIRYLKTKGYKETEIAAKTDLGRDYIHGIINLLEKGEERLINAVENGKMPLYLALKIATEDDAGMQRALMEAHETGQVSGRNLIAVQKMLDRRKHCGKGLYTKPPQKQDAVSKKDLVAFYESKIKSKKKLLVKAGYVEQLLTYSIAALNSLRANVHFTNQLQVAGVGDIPQKVADLLRESK